MTKHVASARVSTDINDRIEALQHRLGLTGRSGKSETIRRLLARGLDSYPADAPVDEGSPDETKVVAMQTRRDQLEARVTRIEEVLENRSGSQLPDLSCRELPLGRNDLRLANDSMQVAA